MVSEIFGPDINLKRKNLDITEIQSMDAKAIVEDKAKKAYQKVERPVVVDDFSFYFSDLGQFPGPMIKHVMNEIGLEGLEKLEELSDGKCFMACNVAFYDGENLEVVEGRLEGKMDYEVANENSKTSLITAFIPKGHAKTLKKLEIENHRQIAFKKLKNKL